MTQVQTSQQDGGSTPIEAECPGPTAHKEIE